MSSTAAPTAQIGLKLTFGSGDLRRTRVDRSATFDQAQSLIAEVAGATADAISVSWTDSDGDTIVVKTDADWAEAIHDHEERGAVVRLNVAVAVLPPVPARADLPAAHAVGPILSPMPEQATVPVPAAPQLAPAPTPTPTPTPDKAKVAKATKATAKKAKKRGEADLLAMRAELESGDVAVATGAAREIRGLLAKSNHPSTQDVIDAGCVPPLVAALGCDGAPKLQFEAAWALTNVAAGTSSQTQTVVDAGAIAEFMRLLKSPDADVAEQAVWALGNLAGDGPALRDRVLKDGLLSPLLAILRQDPPSITKRLQRNATWTLSNLCRGTKPAPKFAAVRDALFTLPRLLLSDDKEVVTDAAWALSYLSDGANNKIESLLRAGVLPQLLGLLEHPSSCVVTPVLRTLGNIVTGDDGQTQQAIDSGLLGALATLDASSKTPENASMRKELAWTIANITAGTTAQIDAVVDAGLIPVIAKLLADTDPKVRKEAAWAVSNLAAGGTTTHVGVAVAHGVLPLFCNLILATEVSDASTVLAMGLEGLARLLEKSEAWAAGCRLCEFGTELLLSCKLEQLMQHSDSAVAEKAATVYAAIGDCTAATLATGLSKLATVQNGQDADPHASAGSGTCDRAPLHLTHFPEAAEPPVGETANLAEIWEQMTEDLEALGVCTDVTNTIDDASETDDSGSEVDVDHSGAEADGGDSELVCHPHQPQLDDLASMGFASTPHLAELLDRHSGSVPAVLDALLG